MKHLALLYACCSIFVDNPFSEELYNHMLKGRLIGYRAFSAGFDLRIIYREENDHLIVFLIRVGTHNQVYP